MDRSNGAVKPGQYKAVRDKPPGRPEISTSGNHFLARSVEKNMTRDEMQVREERHANQAKRPSYARGERPGDWGRRPGPRSWLAFYAEYMINEAARAVTQ